MTFHPFYERLVYQVCNLLSQHYPSSKLGNKKNPLDEYLYIILSLRTNESGYKSAYESFKKRFRSWHDAEQVSVKDIEEAIRIGGLGSQKAKRIKAAFKFIRNELGELSLRSLKSMTQEQVETFLMKLPGIGIKSARCIMMYSLDYKVLPVDTHVARISRRLGWVEVYSSRELHDELEQIVPPSLRYSFHIYCVQHGRAVCRGHIPRCDVCCIFEYCNSKGL